MATVGAVSCDFVHGSIGPKSERLDVYELPGVDGYGAHKLGLGNGDFELVAVGFGSQAVLTAWQTSLKALVGTVVSITTDTGVTTTGCLIKEVGNIEVAAAAWSAGALTDRRGQIQIKGVVT